MLSEEFVQAAKNFRDAALTLSMLCDDNMEQTPFDKSFDELAADITNWVNEMEESDND